MARPDPITIDRSPETPLFLRSFLVRLHIASMMRSKLVAAATILMVLIMALLVTGGSSARVLSGDTVSGEPVVGLLRHLFLRRLAASGGPGSSCKTNSPTGGCR